jgi:NADH-quinone oxidoreductase subunit E/NADP-reducing hydrogenase subunit HndA
MGHLKAEAVAKIREICGRYKDEKTPLMMILSDIQNEYGYIPLDVQEIVSEETGISVAEIYGVVTFYNFFKLQKAGKYLIQVCLGTACYLRGGDDIIKEFEKQLGVGVNTTTPDGLFSVEAVRCIGCCGLAPAVVVNGEVHGKLTKDDVAKIIEKYRQLG